MKKVTLPSLKAKAQKVFNEYIRLRDSEGDYFKCTSCRGVKPMSLANAGHFYSVGHYDGLRYDEDNCHIQCIECNKYLHGNLIEYRDNLVNKIGIKRFGDLQLKAGLYKRNGYKFTRTEVTEIIKLYTQKLKELK